MRTFPSLKRELLLGVALTAFVFVCAWAWGSPFVAPPAAQAQTHAQVQAQSITVSGTVERNGEQFVLREASGQVYRLDDPRDAQTYEGKPVTVTGKLEQSSRMLHVERIAPVTA